MSERWWLIVPIFVALWAAGLVALAATMLLPNFWIRAFWALVIALSGAIGFGFYLVSETELSIFDVVSLWNARHEAGRAMAFYQSSLAGGGDLCCHADLIGASATTLMRFARARRWLFVVPLVPIILYASVIVYRGGDGSRALPASSRRSRSALCGQQDRDQHDAAARAGAVDGGQGADQAYRAPGR